MTKAIEEKLISNWQIVSNWQNARAFKRGLSPLHRHLSGPCERATCWCSGAVYQIGKHQHLKTGFQRPLTIVDQISTAY